jgi:putative FmdB family regulatory protein
MPLYEFQCTKCGTEFEELVLSSKPEALAKVACPSCDSHKVKKKVSTFAAGLGSAATAGASAPGGDSCAPSGG